MRRRPLESELVRRGLARDAAEARHAIRAGRVTIAGAPATKTSTLVSASDAVAIDHQRHGYASRGGDKLAGALDDLGVDPRGCRCLDAGASTGGFTDVLLRRGARRVLAVDVGYGQLAWRLRQDPRVTVLDRTNVRSLERSDLPYAPDLCTADLSFMSLASVVPRLVSLAAPGGDLVLLVKPQFEAARADVERGGIVRQPATIRAAVTRVAEACDRAGAGVHGLAPSRLRGPAGNIEVFIHARVGATRTEVEVQRIVDQATAGARP